MKLTAPFKISSRLLPCVEIGGACVQLAYAKRPVEQGRTRCRWTIDIGDQSWTNDDIQSGCQGGNLQEGFCSLLSFLGAFAEATKSDHSENIGLFPAGLQYWANHNSDEISMAQIEIEESDEPLINE